jgi:hypothetical protein
MFFGRRVLSIFASSRGVRHKIVLCERLAQTGPRRGIRKAKHCHAEMLRGKKIAMFWAEGADLTFCY